MFQEPRAVGKVTMKFAFLVYKIFYITFLTYKTIRYSIKKLSTVILHLISFYGL